jgi:integrase
VNETVKAMLKALDRKGPFVLCNEEGKRFGDIGRSFETALKRSGIEDFRFHDLRHTFASNLVMAGEDLYTVAELLGHKGLEMTRRYAHLSPKFKKKAVAVLDRLMSQNPPHSSLPQKVVALSY